jgi:hypothetical protein
MGSGGRFGSCLVADYGDTLLCIIFKLKAAATVLNS